MKAVFILCDTVNRRMLDFYSGENTALTPNLNRLTKRGVVFDSHWCGSAPCMPARKDIMTGRLDFLEKPWGGIEPFNQTLQTLLQSRNVHTHMYSDHSQYLIPGGENYTKGFTSWEVIRGQERDPWCVKPDQGGIRPDCPPPGYKGGYSESEAANRELLKEESDYPSVKVMTRAAQWLEDNHEADNFMLWVESFDPHEPYDVPQKYLDMYETDYHGPDYNHPDYQPNIFTKEETEHLQNCYKALLTMTDTYLGKIFDVIDRYDMWQDTMLIFTTDHGFHMGEHNYMAKNYMAPYNEVFHIPMIICHPDAQPGRCRALTQNIDLMPTLMEYFGIDTALLHYPLHGRNLLPVLRKEKQDIRESVIFGYYGKQVGYTDGTYVYIRAAKNADNRPLYLYTAIPSILRQYLGADDAVNADDYNKIEMGRFLSWTNYPVYRIPVDIIHYSDASQNFSKRSEFNEENLLFDLIDDYQQENPVQDEQLEAILKERLCNCMKAHDAMPEQFERLGL